MIPPHRPHAAQHFQREIQHVQHYIQSRLQTEEPHLLSVNAAQVEEYYDEVQNYVKQKQRQNQVRRPLSSSRDRPMPAGVSGSKSFTQGTQSTLGSDRSLPRAIIETERMSTPAYSTAPSPAPCSPSSFVPYRLPGVEWLLAKSHGLSHTSPRTGLCTANVPTNAPTISPAVPTTAVPVSRTAPMHAFASHAMQSHRILKKQKTM